MFDIQLCSHEAGDFWIIPVFFFLTLFVCFYLSYVFFSEAVGGGEEDEIAFAELE